MNVTQELMNIRIDDPMRIDIADGKEDTWNYDGRVVFKDGISRKHAIYTLQSHESERNFGDA